MKLLFFGVVNVMNGNWPVVVWRRRRDADTSTSRQQLELSLLLHGEHGTDYRQV